MAHIRRKQARHYLVHAVVAGATALTLLSAALPGAAQAQDTANIEQPLQRLVAQAGQMPPAISCIGGLSTGTVCFCRQPTVKVQTGPNAYRCVMDGMTTGDGNGSAPQRLARPANRTPPAVSCIGGVSTGTACFCRPPTVKVQTGANSYRCVMDGMTSGQGHGGPFINRFDNRPGIMAGSAGVPGHQPFVRPVDRHSSPPPRMMMIR